MTTADPRPVLLALALACSAAAPAAAQSGPPDQEGLSVSLGAAVLARPKYAGSDAYEIDPLPAAWITYDDWLFADPARGAGLSGHVGSALTVSGGGFFMSGREESDDARLIGLGDLDGGATVFGAAELRPFDSGWMQALFMDVRVETPVTGDIGGFEASGGLNAGFPLGGAGAFGSLSLRATWVSEEMMQDVFGVTPAQAAASAFPAFDASSGFRSVGAAATMRQPITGNWSGVVIGAYEHLVGDASDSPISQTDDQFTVAAALLYTFD